MDGLAPSIPSEINFDFAGHSTLACDRVGGRVKPGHDG
jgi:hypothetical protein